MTLSARGARAINHSIVYLLVGIGAIAMLFPLLWTISTSLKTVDQLVATRIVLIPDPNPPVFDLHQGTARARLL